MGDELQTSWKTSVAMSARQKLTTRGLIKNVQNANRVEVQQLVESAQQIRDLQEVHAQMQSVNRQLSFAHELQSNFLKDCKHKLVSRNQQIQKLEHAIFRVVAHAQGEAGLGDAVPGLVAKCGP